MPETSVFADEAIACLEHADGLFTENSIRPVDDDCFPFDEDWEQWLSYNPKDETEPAESNDMRELRAQVERLTSEIHNLKDKQAEQARDTKKAIEWCGEVNRQLQNFKIQDRGRGRQMRWEQKRKQKKVNPEVDSDSANP